MPAHGTVPIFGLYSGFVYFTPVLGGWIADRFVGQRNAVVAGALLMSGGHLAMAFDQSFLVALTLLILGSGLLKGNIAAQVGALYAIDDEANRVRAFTIFHTGINVGAMLGPICGLLAQPYGWRTGFGAAALFILIGLVTYLVGYRHLPSRTERPVRDSRTLTAAEWRRIRAICAVLAIVVCHATSYFQSFNTAAVWTQDHVFAPSLLADAITTGVVCSTLGTPQEDSRDPEWRRLGPGMLYCPALLS